MPFDLTDPDDYFGFIQQLQAVGAEVGESATGAAAVSVHLWCPSTRASSVGAELLDLDLDARRVAAWQPRITRRPLRRLRGTPPFSLDDLLDFGLVSGAFSLGPYPSVMPDPVRPEEGGLEVVRAEQGSSVDIDFQAVGLVLGMLVDTPTLLLWSRVLLRRLPVRIVWRRQPQDQSGDSPIDVHHGQELPAAIEARRLIRRVTVRYPDGSELIEEDFEPAGYSAA